MSASHQIEVMASIGIAVLLFVFIMGLMGYRRRTGFLAGLTVAQISEFSLILAALGVTLGHIGADTLSLITVVGIVTIGFSTYLILYSHRLYDRLEGPLRIFERGTPFREIVAEETSGPVRVDAVVFRLGRFGSNIRRGLVECGRQVLGVDFDHSALRRARGHGLFTQYGDAEDPEILGTLLLQRALWMVSATPLLDTQIALLHALKTHGYEGKVAATAHLDRDAERLNQAGADLVLRPFVDAADQAVDLLAQSVAMGCHAAYMRVLDDR